MEELKQNFEKEFLSKGYMLCDKIGEGGNSYVYKAKQINTENFVAIKILKLPRYFCEIRKLELIVYFKRSIKPYDFLNHKTIINCLESGELNHGIPYAIFEYIPGDTLKQFYIKKKNIRPIETASIMRKVLKALAYTHSQGMVHGDLKPHNIMIYGSKDDLQVKLIDFGFYDSMDTLGNSFQVFLSPQYNAPEQLQGNFPTTQSDLYSWALIFLECLIGTPVVKGNSIDQIKRIHLNRRKHIIPQEILNHPLGNILALALNKDINRRLIDVQFVLDEFSKMDFSTLANCWSDHQQNFQLNIDNTFISFPN